MVQTAASERSPYHHHHHHHHHPHHHHQQGGGEIRRGCCQCCRVIWREHLTVGGSQACCSGEECGVTATAGTTASNPTAHACTHEHNVLVEGVLQGMAGAVNADTGAVGAATGIPALLPPLLVLRGEGVVGGVRMPPPAKPLLLLLLLLLHVAVVLVVVARGLRGGTGGGEKDVPGWRGRDRCAVPTSTATGGGK